MRTLESYQAVLYFDHVFGYITLWICQTSQKVYNKKIHFHLHANLKCYRIYFKMLSINENITTVLYMSIPLIQSKEDLLSSINQLWQLHCQGQPVGWEIISVRCWQEVFVIPESLVCHRQSHTSSRHSLQTETHR